MSFTGHVHNGVVVFDQPVPVPMPLPEGTVVEFAVRIIPKGEATELPTLWDRLAGCGGESAGIACRCVGSG